MPSAYRSSKNLTKHNLPFFNWQRLVIQPIPNFQSQRSHNDSFSFSGINTQYTWYFLANYCLTLYIYSTKIHQIRTMCTRMYRKPKTVLAFKFLWGKGEKPECSKPPSPLQDTGKFGKRTQASQSPHPSPLWKPVATGSTHPALPGAGPVISTA